MLYLPEVEGSARIPQKSRKIKFIFFSLPTHHVDRLAWNKRDFTETILWLTTPWLWRFRLAPKAHKDSKSKKTPQESGRFSAAVFLLQQVNNSTESPGIHYKSLSMFLTDAKGMLTRKGLIKSKNHFKIILLLQREACVKNPAEAESPAQLRTRSHKGGEEKTWCLTNCCF